MKVFYIFFCTICCPCTWLHGMLRKKEGGTVPLGESYCSHWIESDIQVTVHCDKFL